MRGDGRGGKWLTANAVERQWIGVELSEAYRNLARERIAGNERLVDGKIHVFLLRGDPKTAPRVSRG